MSYVGDPAKYLATVTPSDGALFDIPARSLWIGVTGNVSIIDWAGNNVVIPNVPVGVLPVQARGVNATGTSASSILRMWG